MATPTITMQPTDSSNIAAHGYDPATKTLAVQFKSGSLYHYDNVPEEVANEFKNAKSAGSFFAKSIRGNFEALRIEPEAEGDQAA